ncbi:MAG: M20/M25/M40 family metallo-hydrolase [Bacteroidales bacterium]|nr:M20/M25/M40 family metallo-hydrolase [Bacteroidales bacterium]
MVHRQIPYLNKLQELRKELHQFPEYSGREKKTAARVLEYCAAYQPDLVIEKMGGTGFALIYEGDQDGKTVLLRAELDALPLNEVIDMPHRSRYKDLAHKCGHDGHITILCGVAALLHERRPKTGRVVLLFQPAEETGKGAMAVLKDPKLQGALPELPRSIPELHKNTLLTITYSRLGHFCFGNSYKLEPIIQWHEPFGPIINAPEAVNLIRSAARKLELPLVERKEPLTA